MKFLHAVSLPFLALLGLASSCGDSPAPSESESSGASAGATSAYRPETAPNFLIFMIDTQRADYMGLYGSERDTTPNIDAFAQESLVFERAYAPASSTSPSHASLFTSTYPRVHGVWNRVPRGEEEPIFPALSGYATTLAEVLGEVGYDTAAICSRAAALPRASALGIPNTSASTIESIARSAGSTTSASRISLFSCSCIPTKYTRRTCRNPSTSPCSPIRNIRARCARPGKMLLLSTMRILA
jgi:Sulfatase